MCRIDVVLHARTEHHQGRRDRHQHHRVAHRHPHTEPARTRFGSASTPLSLRRVPSVVSAPDNSLRVSSRYIVMSGGTPLSRCANTGRRNRLASTPSSSSCFGRQLLQRGTGDQHAALTGAFHHPRGDVHVDPQPVGTDPLRPTGMDTDPHRSAYSPPPQRFSVRRARHNRCDRGDRIGEHRHDPVAHPLHHLTADIQQRRLDRLRDLAKQLEGGVVARAAAPTTRSRPGR